MWSLGAAVVYNFLPSYAISSGFSGEHGCMLLAIVGISSLVIRPMFHVFYRSEKLDHGSVILCTVILSAILTGVFPELFKHKAGQIGYAIIFGVHSGFWANFMSQVSSDMVGTDYSARGRGFVSLAIGAGFLTGSPLAAWVLDRSNEFKIIFYMAGTAERGGKCTMPIVRPNSNFNI